MPLDLCTPGNRDILERNICLSALSKNLKGELKPLHHALERCAKLKCRTLKTIHFLELHVATNAPCDSAPGKLLDGNFIVRNLITAFENGSPTVTLTKNKALTLMNTADGTRYVLRLVSVS